MRRSVGDAAQKQRTHLPAHGRVLIASYGPRGHEALGWRRGGETANTPARAGRVLNASSLTARRVMRRSVGDAAHCPRRPRPHRLLRPAGRSGTHSNAVTESVAGDAACPSGHCALFTGSRQAKRPAPPNLRITSAEASSHRAAERSHSLVRRLSRCREYELPAPPAHRSLPLKSRSRVLSTDGSNTNPPVRHTSRYRHRRIADPAGPVPMGP
jgi:hypothetical protein